MPFNNALIIESPSYLPYMTRVSPTNAKPTDDKNVINGRWISSIAQKTKESRQGWVSQPKIIVREKPLKKIKNG